MSRAKLFGNQMVKGPGTIFVFKHIFHTYNFGPKDKNPYFQIKKVVLDINFIYYFSDLSGTISLKLTYISSC